MAVALRCVAVAGLLLFALPGVLPGVDAQAGSGTLYLTNALVTAPTGAGGSGIKIFALAQEAAAAEGKAYTVLSPGPVTYQTNFEYSAATAFTLSGNLESTIYLGCDTAAVFRPSSNNGANNVPTMAMVLFKGATQISRADIYAATPPTCTGPSSVIEQSFAADSKGTAFEAGEKLVVQYLLWWTTPDEGQAKNGHFKVGGTARASRISAVGLPLAGGDLPASPIHGNLTGDAVDLRLPFPEPTTADYTYNWTGLESAQISYDGEVRNGTVHFVIKDNASAELLNATLAAPANRTLNVTAPAGNWTIAISFQGYQGNFSLAIAAPPPVVSTTTSFTGTGPTRTSTGTVSGDGPGDGTDDGGKKKGSPGLALPLVMATLAGLALARRRTR